MIPETYYNFTTE